MARATVGVGRVRQARERALEVEETPCRSASKPARAVCTARLHFESWEQTSPVFAFLMGGKPRKSARCLAVILEANSRDSTLVVCS